MISYCLFCNTSRCDRISALLVQQIACEAYSPKIVQRKWIKGKCYEVINDYLPGYVFLFSEDPLGDLQKVYSVDGVIRFLGNKKEGFQLQGEDRQFSQMIYDNHGVIGIMKAYQEGDRIKLLDSSFAGLAGEIIKVDRRKGRAQVCIHFDKKDFLIWVGYDLIEKAGK